MSKRKIIVIHKDRKEVSKEESRVFVNAKINKQKTNKTPWTSRVIDHVGIGKNIATISKITAKIFTRASSRWTHVS